MREKTDVLQGTLALMVLKTPVLLKLEAAIIGRFFEAKAEDFK